MSQRCDCLSVVCVRNLVHLSHRLLGQFGSEAVLGASPSGGAGRETLRSAESPTDEEQELRPRTEKSVGLEQCAAPRFGDPRL